MIAICEAWRRERRDAGAGADPGVYQLTQVMTPAHLRGYPGHHGRRADHVGASGGYCPAYRSGQKAPTIFPPLAARHPD
jgi:hypothetical protein